jgi:hypothetical protein
VGTYHPSFGTGGYCIPLAPQYVLEGAKHPEKLTLITESLKFDFSQPEEVVKSILKRGAKRVGVLGIAYTGDLKVHVLSPSMTILKLLKEKNVDVKVNDPYYTSEEVKRLTGCETMDFPEGMSDRDTILIVSPHMKFKYVDHRQIMDNLGSVKLILDNMGIWKDKKMPKSIEYHEAGDAHWLE